MIELTQHLESLLLDNNCVILPDFGGFITFYSAAQWIEEEELYLPPTRTIGFNPQLKINDGLLAQSYMQVCNTDFTTASGMVDEAVTKLTTTLQEEGKVILQGIGTLTLAIDNSYKFQPNEDGLFTPALYGLSSFGIKALQSVIASKEETKRLTATTQGTPTDRNILPEKKKKETSTYSPRPIIRYTMAAAIAIIAFFIMSTPLENTYIDTDSYAELINFDHIINTTIEKPLLVKNIIEPTGNKDVTDNQNTKSTEETKPEKESTPADEDKIQETSQKNTSLLAENTQLPKVVKEESVPKVTSEAIALTPTANKNQPITNPELPRQNSNLKRYDIIVASIAANSNTDMILEGYKKQGYENVSIVKRDGRVRVSLMNFDNSPKAATALKELKQNKQFKDAWLLITKSK